MSISWASELESSLLSFASSDSTSTWQGGVKEREDGEKVCVCWGGGGRHGVGAIKRGSRLIEQQLLFEEIRYFYLFART